MVILHTCIITSMRISVTYRDYQKKDLTDVKMTSMKSTRNLRKVNIIWERNMEQSAPSQVTGRA